MTKMLVKRRDSVTQLNRRIIFVVAFYYKNICIANVVQFLVQYSLEEFI